MVHGAVATSILIEEFAPRLIINQGTAGAVNPALAVGDIVLGLASAPFGAVKTAHRDLDQGVDLDGWVTSPRKLRKGEDRVLFENFPSDRDLLSTALTVPYDGGRLIEGIVGSGDQWNREIDKLLWAHELWNIDSEDMESAAVAQVAEIYGIPFLPVRVISNSEHTDPVFREETGSDCAAYVVELVKALADEGA
jgi:adenosylhomocysteine nucleosidase